MNLKATPKEEPKREVGSSFGAVLAHASTPAGIDPRKIDELQGRYEGRAGYTRRCDVLGGPCACGAWH